MTHIMSNFDIQYFPWVDFQPSKLMFHNLPHIWVDSQVDSPIKIGLDQW